MFPPPRPARPVRPTRLAASPKRHGRRAARLAAATNPRPIRRATSEARETDMVVSGLVYREIMRLLEEGRVSDAAARDALTMATDELDDRRASRSLTWSDSQADCMGRDIE